MIKNFFVTGWRHILRHKLFSAINIGGLAVGLAAAILILLFVRDEFSWDSWVPEAEKIYRMELISFPPGRQVTHLGMNFTPIAQHLKQDFPQIEHMAQYRGGSRTVVRDGQSFSEQVNFVTEEFFDIYQLEMVEGERTSALRDNNSVVLSQSAAKKHFGDGPALGRTLHLANGNSYRVTGVFADAPPNSHLNLNMLFPLSVAEFPPDASGVSPLEQWFNLGTFTYIKLDRPDSLAAVQAGMDEFLDKRGPRPGDNIVPSKRWNMKLINTRDIHLDGAPRGRIKPPGSRSGALIFAAIALLILMIGCFNFINLSTAKASLRAKEVAVRKVFGASQRQLFGQFLGEVGLIVVIAFALALLLVEAALPWYNGFISKVLSLDVGGDPMLIVGIVGLLFIVVLGAGAHPAITISAFRPADTLKAGARKTTGSSKIRTLLVGLQFAIAIGLIISSVVVYSQVQFGLNRDTGYNAENLLFLRHVNNPLVQPRRDSLKQSLLDHPDITAVSFSSASPADHITALTGFGNINGEVIEPIMLNFTSVDEDYFDTYEIDVLAGRVFDSARPSDISRPRGGGYQSASIVLSESAVTKLGFTSNEEALGATLGDEETNSTVIGVVADTHNGSARSEINPNTYLVDEEFYNRLSLRYDTDDEARLLADVDRIWADLVPQVPISRSFLDEQISAQYDSERSRGMMFAIFAGLAILIASLGLYGLSAFTIEQKTREIGLRKVLGASVPNIVKHLVWQSSKPVLFANLAAWPVAWYFMSDWLEGFIYRINLTPLPFVIAGVAALLISVLSVGGYAWTVARAKPVNALRYE